MSAAKSLVTNKACADCEHVEVCRHREDYLAFVDAIGEFSERYNGKRICDGVVAVNVSCNYYTPVNSDISWFSNISAATSVRDDVQKEDKNG